MQVNCRREDCGGVVALSGVSHSVGSQPFRTEATCPTCGTRWRVFFGDSGQVTQVVEITEPDDA